MSEFSIGDAVGSGFSLIAKRPLSVLAWSVVYLVLVVAPALAQFAMIRPAWSAMMQSLLAHMHGGGPPDFSDMRGFDLQMMQSAGALMWLSPLGALFSWAILSAAVYRSVLEPKNTSFASLRFGAQELWLVLLIIVFFIVMVVAEVAIGVVAGILCVLAALVAHAMPRPGGLLVGGLLFFLIGLGAIWAFLMICVRLSLAGPLTFKERQFRLFESWRLTKGHGWRLFGLAALIFLIMIALYLVFAAIKGAVFFGMLGVSGFDPMRMGEMLASGSWWRPMSPWFVAGAVVQAVVGAAFLVIMVAPWATAFKELGGEARPDHPAVF